MILDFEQNFLRIYQNQFLVGSKQIPKDKKLVAYLKTYKKTLKTTMKSLS